MSAARNMKLLRFIMNSMHAFTIVEDPDFRNSFPSEAVALQI